jgi:predicted transglutaminase-like cysteine proteinase
MLDLDHTRVYFGCIKTKVVSCHIDFVDKEYNEVTINMTPNQMIMLRDELIEKLKRVNE